MKWWNDFYQQNVIFIKKVGIISPIPGYLDFRVLLGMKVND